MPRIGAATLTTASRNFGLRSVSAPESRAQRRSTYSGSSAHRRSGERFSSHHCTSLPHQTEAVDAGLARNKNHSDTERCPTMPDHSAGLAVRLV